MAIVFPSSPSVNETFTAGSITYKWDGAKWIGLGVTPTDRLIEGSNSLEIDASNQLVWSGDDIIQSSANKSFKSNSTSSGDYVRMYAGGGTAQWDIYGNGELLRMGDNSSSATARVQFDNPTFHRSTATTTGVAALTAKQEVNNGGYLIFDGKNSSDTTVFSVTHNGRVAVSDGIDFSSNANTTGMTSELLDDYEEGDWTPRISFGGGETGITYSTQVGNYTKIGRQVTVTGYLTLSNKGTSTGELRIEGLPFTVRNGSGAYNYQNMFYQNILPSNIHTGKEIMTGGSQWFSPGFFGVDKAYQLNNFEVYTHVRFRRLSTTAYSWCLLFVTSNGGSPATYTTQFAAVINVPAGGVLGEEIIMPFLNAPGDASLAAGTNQGGVQMLYGAPATTGTPHYIGWLSGDGGVGNNGTPQGGASIFVTSSPTGGNIDYIQVNTTPTVGQTYGPVTATDTGTDIHIAVFRDGGAGWCGPQTGNIGGFVVPNTTSINVRTIRNSIIGHAILTDVSVVNNTQLGAFSWTYFTD